MARRGRNMALLRCLKLARQLEDRRTRPDLQQLAAEHQVTKRTIYRDLRALEEAGVRLPKGFHG